jgi:hypothetical protein
MYPPEMCGPGLESWRRGMGPGVVGWVAPEHAASRRQRSATAILVTAPRTADQAKSSHSPNALPGEPLPYNWLPMGRDLALRLAADRPGELARVAQTLSSSGVNIEGIAEIEGVVHVLARDPGAARSALRAGGYTIDGELEVLVLPMTDRPGELSMIMQRLADASVNLRFVYLATDTRVVIGVDDITRARAALDSSKN